VLALTDENDFVFDPYCGVGSSLVGSLFHNRKGVGCEKESQYIEIAKERIYSYYSGTLKIRPLGKPIFKPTGKEKVSQMPIEWVLLKSERDN
jgi:adenine-specific DNA-methyltransferase